MAFPRPHNEPLGPIYPLVALIRMPWKFTEMAAGLVVVCENWCLRMCACACVRREENGNMYSHCGSCHCDRPLSRANQRALDALGGVSDPTPQLGRSTDAASPRILKKGFFEGEECGGLEHHHLFLSREQQEKGWSWTVGNLPVHWLRQPPQGTILVYFPAQT